MARHIKVRVLGLPPSLAQECCDLTNPGPPLNRDCVDRQTKWALHQYSTIRYGVGLCLSSSAGELLGYIREPSGTAINTPSTSNIEAPGIASSPLHRRA